MAFKFLSFLAVTCISSSIFLVLPFFDIHLFKRYYAEQCTTDSQCFQDKGLICAPSGEELVCRCRDFEYWSPLNYKCNPKHSFKGGCKTSDECSVDKGLTCQSGECICQYYHFFDKESDVCTLKFEAGESCVENSNCQEFAGLKCNENKCQCINDNQSWNAEKSLCVDKLSHKEACQVSSDCGDTLMCLEGQCQCEDSKYFSTGVDQCIERGLGNSACITDNECSSLKDLVCIDNKCKCSDPKKYFASFANECVIGLSNDATETELFSSGYNVVYNVTYDTPTKVEDIKQIRTHCNQNSVLCLAASNPDKSESLQLELIACGNCFVITTETTKSKPQFHGAAWWYYTPDLSLGFAPNEKVQQVKADPSKDGANYRLSWHLDGSGGWRAGAKQSLIKNKLTFKYAFLKY